MIQEFLDAGPQLLAGAGYTLLYTVLGAAAALVI